MEGLIPLLILLGIFLVLISAFIGGWVLAGRMIEREAERIRTRIRKDMNL